MIVLHNEVRTQHSLPPLEFDAGLNSVAMKHATWMAEHNHLVHQDIKKLMNDGWMTAGENIAEGQQDDKEALDSWMHSSGHRANILNRKYTHCGFGVARSKNGRLFWCMDFGGK